MGVPILVSPRLHEHLLSHGIKPETYNPAYDGESAGLDLYYCGKHTIEVQNGYFRAWIPGASGNRDIRTGTFGALEHNKEIALLDTGLRVSIPPCHVGLIMERGGITKTQVSKRAGVIDPSYSGTIFVNLVGLTGYKHQSPWRLRPGDKLPVQLVVLPCDNHFKPIDKKTFEQLHRDSQRREGKTGSSD